jgi:hypothetical protein
MKKFLETDDPVYKVHLYPHLTHETNKGEMKKEFDENEALALLLAKGVIFINNHWWEKEYSEQQKDLFSINVNLNDVFYPGADAEELCYSEFEDFFNCWENDPDFGVIKYMSKKRKILPSAQMIEYMKNCEVYNDEDFAF